MIWKWLNWKVPVYAILAAVIISGTGLIILLPRLDITSAGYQFELPSPFIQPRNFTKGSWPALNDLNFFKTVRDRLVASRSDFIEANLSTMKLTYYRQGEPVEEVDILTKGRPGSWWETPAGLYEVRLKSENAFSSFGHVYMPWSMQFEGNFFIHGWPYYPDGRPVETQYSGGCIRLSTEDAKKVYELAKVGVPVLVYESDFAQDDFQYAVEAPRLLGSNYLVADIKNNFAFLQHNASSVVPVASLTKLITALVVTEYINVEKKVTVTKDMLVPTSKPRLKEGESYAALDLLYPLLMESSNEAAEALSRFLGRERFVKLMNEKAASLGMERANFVDPSGISPENKASTEDLFQLAKYLYHNRSFILKITAGKGYNPAYGAPLFDDLENFNIFEKDPQFVGGKVGETREANETVLAVFDVVVRGQKRPVALVILGSDNREVDARAAIEYVRSNYATPEDLAQ